MWNGFRNHQSSGTQMSLSRVILDGIEGNIYLKISLNNLP